MSEQQAYETLIHNKNNVDYVGWAGVKTLPEFDTFNVEYKEYIFNIVRKWMYGPDGVANDDYTIDDGIDGFRLDVPNCLENQDFWSEFRVVVKEAKKDAFSQADKSSVATIGDIDNVTKGIESNIKNINNELFCCEK